MNHLSAAPLSVLLTVRAHLALSMRHLHIWKDRKWYGDACTRKLAALHYLIQKKRAENRARVVTGLEAFSERTERFKHSLTPKELAILNRRLRK